MNDQEKQAMIDKMVAGGLYIKGLSDEDFYGLLEGLTRMYFARVWNCCDASGKMDHEWSALSDIFQRVCEERGAKRASRHVRGESIAAPHPDPLTPEEELADTIKRQKELDV